MKKIFDAIIKGIDWFSKYWALVIVPLFMLPAIEAVVFRYTLRQPTIWNQELCCMIFGAFFMIGGAYGESVNAHVSMDLVYNHYRGVVKIIADTIGFLACTLLCAILIWKGGQTAINAVQINLRSESLWEPVLWPVRWCIPIGAFLLEIRTLDTYIKKVKGSIQWIKNKKAAKLEDNKEGGNN